MDRIYKFVQSISNIGLVVGSVFLFINAFLVVTNVVSRGFGSSITGAYELIVLLIVPPVAFALFKTTLDDGHVSVKFLRERFSQRGQGALGRFVWLVTLLWWGLVTWAAIDIMLDKWTRECTELLEVPYLPFRFVWIFFLIFMCVAALLHFCRGKKGGAES